MYCTFNPALSLRSLTLRLSCAMPLSNLYAGFVGTDGTDNDSAPLCLHIYDASCLDQAIQVVLRCLVVPVDCSLQSILDMVVAHRPLAT